MKRGDKVQTTNKNTYTGRYQKWTELITDEYVLEKTLASFIILA
jgi:hypothetical protein